MREECIGGIIDPPIKLQFKSFCYKQIPLEHEQKFARVLAPGV